MKINFKILCLSLMMSSALYAQQTSLETIREDVESQAQAVKTLASKADALQKGLDISLAEIDVNALDGVLQRLQNQANNAQDSDTVLHAAQAVSKVLNEVADLGLRLQHQVGIQPQDTQTTEE